MSNESAVRRQDAPSRRDTVRRRVSLSRHPGPLLVEGPVEVTLEDGTTVSSDRFCVALCTCRRSRIHPWCDTSHRRRATSTGSSTATTPTATAETPRRTQPPPSV